MQILETIAALHQWRQDRCGSLALVPTMGALHAGHAALMTRAREHATHVMATLFVNPTQFGPGEDFDRYPRTWDADVNLCRERGVDALFAPCVQAIYPEGQVAVHLEVPGLTTMLEGEKRPGHFAGVCRVVAKLFGLTRPDVAIFGQKDYQQLAVIRAMVADLAMPVAIVAAATVREDDGLAMSSRNRYLDGRQRSKAVGLVTALRDAQARVQAGERSVHVLEKAMADIISAHDFALDYAVVRDAVTLAPLPALAASTPAVALVAARLGQVRLIDNMPLELSPGKAA